jgi:hypothetical protein
MPRRRQQCAGGERYAAMQRYGLEVAAVFSGGGEAGVPHLLLDIRGGETFTPAACPTSLQRIVREHPCMLHDTFRGHALHRLAHPILQCGRLSKRHERRQQQGGYETESCHVLQVYRQYTMVAGQYAAESAPNTLVPKLFSAHFCSEEIHTPRQVFP